MVTPVKQFTAALAAAQKNYQRRLIVLRGGIPQTLSVLGECLHAVSCSLLRNALWVGDSEPPPWPCLAANTRLKATKANQHLGTGRQLVIINAHEGFNPDAVAALAGTLEGGGLLVILAPALEHWLSPPDADYQRMLVYPQQQEDIKGRFICWIDQQLQPQPGLVSINVAEYSAESAAAVEPEPGLTFTQEERDHLASASSYQAMLVTKMVDRLLKGANTLILRADRGRGKSAALGLAAAQLQQQGLRVVVTAPRPEAVATVFDFAEKALGSSTQESQQATAALQFMAPDELIRHPPDVDVLLVDEAAAIPLPMLGKLLSRFPRIVFSSTVHGYEGTGRGFDIRFAKQIRRTGRETLRFELQEPMRWSVGDPLEHWINQTFLLDAEIEDLHEISDEQLASAKVQQVSQDQLFADQALLKAVYALLVQAHYRTTPGDLRDLFDGALSLWVQIIEVPGAGSSIIGVMLLAKEGQLPEDLSQQVWAGRRRPRGHLFPQYMTAQAGYLEAASFACLRVVRIAVHPQLQSRGLGSQLLAALESIARQQQVALVGALFAASADLLQFWQDNHYSVLRLGVSRDASSGCYTAIVAKPVTDQAVQLCQRIQEDFVGLLQSQLTTVWRDLEADLVQTALRQLPAIVLSEQQLKDAATFVFGFRGFDQVCSSLRLLVINYLAASDRELLTGVELQLLVSEVLQYQTMDTSGLTSQQVSDFQGRKARHQRIKQLLADYLREQLEIRKLGSIVTRLTAAQDSANDSNPHKKH